MAGWAVQLPGWTYPVVCQTDTASLHFDHYQGNWGEPSRLDAFLQAYTVEKTRLEANRQGHNLIEQSLADGSIKLTIQVGGAP